MTGYVFNGDDGASDWEQEVRIALSDLSELEAVFQPIRGLGNGEVVAVEGLIHSSRVDSGELFSRACALGMEVSLEMATLERLLEWLQLADGPRLSLNVTPGAIANRGVREMLAPFASQIILEVSERSFLPAPKELASELIDLRSQGAQLALDNAGAGFGGLRLLLALEPEWVKLDRVVVSRLRDSSDQLALAAAFVEISHDVGARAIAVGVEYVEELGAVAALGVEAWQGYLDAETAGSVEVPMAKIVYPEPPPGGADFVVELGSSLDLILAGWSSGNNRMGSGFAAVHSRGKVIGYVNFDEVAHAYRHGGKLAGLA